jgi:replicative DNA helicase
MLTFDEREAQSLAVAQLDQSPIYFDSRSRKVVAFNSSVRQVRSKNRRAVGIVDYLQLIRGSGRNRAQEVSDNSRALKLTAMDLDMPLVVLSQVDRGSVKGDSARIGLHSAKESGDCENDADVVAWIEAGELSRDHDTSVSFHVGKQREGPAGFSIPMIFRPQNQVFLEVSE